MNLELSNSRHFLTCKDRTVSGESFDLLYSAEYDLLVTSPKPKPEKLPEYYQSDAYISHTDSSKTFFDQVYQWVKSMMLKKKIGLLENHFPQKGNVLDIGAGTGDFLKSAKNSGWEIHGAEPSKKARELACKKEIVLTENTEGFSGSTFDVITMWHVLEHVPDLEKQLQELDRLLKPNGKLIIAVPNFKSYDAKHYRQFWAAYDVPRHLWHFSKAAISKIFKEFQFELIETHPLKFDAYYVSLLSEKHKTGKPNVAKAFWTGFRSNQKAKRTNAYSSLIYVLKRH